MKRILIATDGSAVSRAAVAEGVAFAADLKAAVTFVSVYSAPSSMLGSPHYERELSEERAPARDAVEEGLAAAAKQGVEADFEIVEGDPAEELLRLARSRGADLVVVGSRGLGVLAGALLGSVSRAVLHGADGPVLVVRTRP